MDTFAQTVSQSLFGERLFDIINTLVYSGPIGFCRYLKRLSQEASTDLEISNFYGVITRINEIDDIALILFPELSKKFCQI
jgi:hypothetical protein